MFRENIRLGKLDASDAEIEEAARKANAHEFIMSTTDKYDTLVGERGAHLSGGKMKLKGILIFCSYKELKMHTKVRSNGSQLLAL